MADGNPRRGDPNGPFICTLKTTSNAIVFQIPAGSRSETTFLHDKILEKKCFGNHQKEGKGERETRGRRRILTRMSSIILFSIQKFCVVKRVSKQP